MSEELVASGCTKQDFKEAVARRLLEQLVLRGYVVPPHFSSPDTLNKLLDLVGLPTYSCVVLVSELCREYHLDPVEYEVLADPAGQHSITVKVRVGHVERVATADSKRTAHQLAAEQIYKHLRTMLRGTMDFNEEDAMFRAYTRTMRQVNVEQGASPLKDQQHGQKNEQAAVEPTQLTEDEKNNQNMAVDMELDQPEHSGQTSYEVGPALPPPGLQSEHSRQTSYEVGPALPIAGPSNAPELDANNAQAAEAAVQQAAIQLLQLTMERLGI